MKNLYQPDVDTSVVDNLVSGTLIPCKVISVTLTANKGTIKRGTPLTSADGVTYTKCTGTDDIHAILWNDVDTDDEDEAVGGAAAFSGEFNQNKIEDVLELTRGTMAPLAIAEARGRQIYIAPMEPDPEAYTI